MMRILALLLSLIAVSWATTGFDAIQAISKADFECLVKDKYTFFIARAWRSSGTYDATGMQNIKNAHAGGMPHVDAYVFPCTKSSCAHATNQIEAVVNKLKAEGAKIGTLWLDIEILDWPANHASNRQFIQDMIHQAEKMGETVGIYSNYNNWQSVVGLEWTAISHYPLWWATYNGHANFENFKAFGGWTKPNIHQYQGTTKGPCGVSMDLNWYP